MPDMLGVCSAEFGLRRGIDARLARGISGPAISRIFQGGFCFSFLNQYRAPLGYTQMRVATPGAQTTPLYGVS